MNTKGTGEIGILWRSKRVKPMSNGLSSYQLPACHDTFVMAGGLSWAPSLQRAAKRSGPELDCKY